MARRKDSEKTEIKLHGNLLVEASLFPLRRTAIQQEEQVKQGMLQCHANQVADVRPAKYIMQDAYYSYIPQMQ